MVCVAFQWRLAFSAVAAITFSQNWTFFIKIVLLLNSNYLERFGHDFRLRVQAYVRVLLVEDHRLCSALRILFEILTACSYHVSYEFLSKSALYSWPEWQRTLKVKWQQRNSTRNHLVRKRTFSHLAKLANLVAVTKYEFYLFAFKTVHLNC